MKRTVVLALCAVVLALCQVAPAQIATEVELIFGQGLQSQYTAATATQALQLFNGARVYTDDPGTPIHNFMEAGQVINASFTGAANASGGGWAHATFSGGSWAVELYSGGNKVLAISGGVDWYKEDETAIDVVNGLGHLTIDWLSVYFDETYWGAGTTWGAGVDGKSGVDITYTGANQPVYGGDLQDYLNDWDCGNVRALIYADSSNVIPEPATICLLGFGGLALVRRKRA